MNIEIELTPKTKKGKDRISQHGNRWIVTGRQDEVIFAPGRKGPWLMLESLQTNDKRWVHETHDDNFVVTTKV